VVSLLPNYVYDLLNQLVQESQSLWRIQKEYKANAQHCKECLDFWDKMEKDKEAHIAELEKLLSEQLK
jgi:hypothetical protein